MQNVPMWKWGAISLSLALFFSQSVNSANDLPLVKWSPNCGASLAALSVPANKRSDVGKPISCAGCETFRPIAHQYEADVKRDGSHAFVVAGDNSDEVISKLTGITGIDLTILEKRARPTGDAATFLGETAPPKEWEGMDEVSIRRSGGGFIGKEQSLRELLITDNRTVHGHKLTHQKVASPLLDLMETYENSQSGMAEGNKGWLNAARIAVFEKEINGRKYKFEALPPKGWGSLLSINGTGGGASKSGWMIKEAVQGSFFNDSLFANYHYRITEVSTGNTLEGDALTPHLVYRYGFYQGAEYRMSPAKLIEFFHLKP